MMRIVLIMLLLGSMANAKKVALVMGNSSYKVGYLPNPINDAKLIAKKLKEVGFSVTLKRNIKSAYSMKTTINQFAKSLNKEDIAVVYYSGHGVQYAGKNYLMPTRANVIKGAQLPSEALDLNFLLAGVSDIKLAILLIDACRNNPYPAFQKSVSRGLVQPNTNSNGGMTISFATAPNATASDGEGKHSPYALALSHYITKPQPIERFFKNVGKSVFYTTHQKQKPMLKLSFYDEFSFVKERKKETTKVKHNRNDITKIGKIIYQNQAFSKQDKRNYDANKLGGRVWDWRGAKTYCQNLVLGEYNDWRVPTRKELRRIANFKLYYSDGNYKTSQEWSSKHKKKYNEYWNNNKHKRNSSAKGNKYFTKQKFIENMPPLTGIRKYASFWTSTERDRHYASNIDFKEGNEGWGNKVDSYYVLCVH